MSALSSTSSTCPTSGSAGSRPRCRLLVGRRGPSSTSARNACARPLWMPTGRGLAGGCTHRDLDGERGAVGHDPDPHLRVHLDRAGQRGRVDREPQGRAEGGEEQRPRPRSFHRGGSPEPSSEAAVSAGSRARSRTGFTAARTAVVPLGCRSCGRRRAQLSNATAALRRPGAIASTSTRDSLAVPDSARRRGHHRVRGRRSRRSRCRRTVRPLPPGHARTDLGCGFDRCKRPLWRRPASPAAVVGDMVGRTAELSGGGFASSLGPAGTAGALRRGAASAGRPRSRSPAPASRREQASEVVHHDGPRRRAMDGDRSSQRRTRQCRARTATSRARRR